MTTRTTCTRAGFIVVLSLTAGVAASVPGRAAAQDRVARWMAGARDASAAAQHDRALAFTDSLLALLPHHPNVVLTRARILSQLGRHDQAARLVEQLERWDARYARRALEDSAFAPIRRRLDTARIHARARAADLPIAQGHLWAVVEERDLVPEGTAWDPITRALLLGSLNKHKVVAVHEDGTVRDRVPSGAHGLASVAGIHVDPVRGRLWVTSNARYDTPDDTTSSALYEFEAATGAFRARHALPERVPSFLNDLTTGPDGTVYMTDTRAATVWRLVPGGRLERFPGGGPRLAPNGITISDDGRHLFIADHDHIQVVALDRGDTWRLAMPDSINITSVDGLAFADGTLIAHHPLSFWRIARYPLDSAHRALTGRVLLERGTADSRTATTGEVVGRYYLHIGNGQLDRMNERRIDSADMQPVRIYRIPLGLLPPSRVVVALSGRDSVAVLDGHTLERLTALPVGRNPHEISPSPDGRRAYVADARGGTVSVLSVDPPRVVATWRVRDSVQVHDVAADPDGRTVWAASGEGRQVLELDASTGVLRRLHRLGRPGSWMLEPPDAGGRVVVAHLEGGAISVLDRHTGEQRIIEAREGEIDARLAPNGREIWSVNLRDHRVTVHDVASGRELAGWPAGSTPGRVVFTPDGRTALVVSSGDATILAYDVVSRRPTGTLSVPAGPKVIALSPDGRRGYVSHPEAGLVTMIDVPALAVMRTAPVPGTPDGIAVLEPR